MQAAPWAVVGSDEPPLSKPEPNWCHTGEFANDCLSNWLGCASDDADEAVQLPI